MFLIVMGHYWYNTMKEMPSNNAFPIEEAGDYLMSQALFSLSAIGVNCFVMITGYFLIHSRRFRYGGALRVALQTVFYSLAICLLFRFLPGQEAPSPHDWLISFEPIPLHHHWFIAKYIALLAVSPLLAILVSQLSRKQYSVMMFLLLVLLFQYPLGDTFGGGMSLSWFVFLFLTGGFFRLYPPISSPHKSFALAGGILVAITGIHAIPGIVASLANGTPLTLKLDGNHSFTYFLSCAVFLCFSNTEMNGRAARAISRLAPYTLGIYLIHEHWLMRGVLWKGLVPSLTSSPGIAACLCSAVSIFAFCAAADSLRQLVFRLCGIERLSERLARHLPQPFEKSSGIP